MPLFPSIHASMFATAEKICRTEHSPKGSAVLVEVSDCHLTGGHSGGQGYSCMHDEGKLLLALSH